MPQTDWKPGPPPQPLITVTFDVGLTLEEKAVCLDYIDALYREQGGSGLVQVHPDPPETET